MGGIEESAMAKASAALPWEWIVEKLVDNKDIGTQLLKAMVFMHIPDINNSSCSNLQERIALRYMEEVLLLDRVEAHAIPLVKVLVNSSIPNSSSAADQGLLLRVCTEVVLGHVRELDENGERDWNGFEDDLKRIFTEEDSSLPFINRRSELLRLLEDKNACLSTLEKYPIETLKYDLHQFVRMKKASLNRPVLDQLVYDVSKGRHFPSLLHYTHPSPTGKECNNSGGRKRLYREADLPYKSICSEGEKRLKHGGKDSSQSNIEKRSECIIEKTYSVSENGCQNNSLCTSTQNFQKDSQTTTGNGMRDIGSKLEIHISGDEKLQQLSSGTKSTSNGHSHCSERRDDGVCCLEGETDEPKEESNSEATTTRERNSLEAEELPELDLLIPSKDGQEQTCFKCREGGVLSCCSGCSIAVHEKCFQLDASTIPGETFDCLVCSYKRALVAYQKAKKDAIESKKRLLAFLNIRSVQGKEQRARNNNHKECEKGGEACANKMKTSEEIFSHTSDFSSGSKRKHAFSKSSGISVHGDKRPGGIENDLPCEQNEADDDMHGGDLEDGNIDDGKYHLRNRKSTMRGTCRLPGARRNKLVWTKAEEEALKEGMEKFAMGKTNGIPWKRIWEHGKGIFDKSRLPTDLKDKWRNMKKSNS